MFSHLFNPKNTDRTKVQKIARSVMRVVSDQETDYDKLVKQKSFTEAYQEFTEKYAVEERWRIFVDGTKYANGLPKTHTPYTNTKLASCYANLFNITHLDEPFLVSNEKGWIGYESRERGAIAACLHALQYALNSACMADDLNNNKIKEIHRRLTDTLQGKNEYYPGRYKTECFTNIEIAKYAVDPAGVKDLFVQIADERLPGAFICTNAETIRNALQLSTTKNLANDIITISLDASNGKCYLNKHNLDEIKHKFPHEYDAFISDFSTYSASHNKASANFYSVYSAQTKNLGKLKLDIWSQLDLPTEIKALVEKDFKKATLDLNAVLTYIKTVPSDLWGKIDSFIKDKLYDKNENSLDDESVKRLYEAFLSATHIEPPDIKIDDNDKTRKTEAYRDAYRKHFASLAMDAILLFDAYTDIGTAIETELDKVWEDYYNKINSATSTKERLNIIGRTIQHFQRIHSFTDGVGRTYVNVLLNVLLLQNGYPPATFADPNMFDAFDDVGSLIMRGILNTLEIYDCYDNHKEVDLFGVKTKKIDDHLNYKISKARSKLSHLSDATEIETLKEKIAKWESCKMESIVNAGIKLCHDDKEMMDGYCLNRPSRMDISN